MLGITDDILKLLTVDKKELTDEQKETLKTFEQSREDFYKAKYEIKVDEKELKKETYNEVLHVLRNDASKILVDKDLKAMGHKEILKALTEHYETRIGEVKGTDTELTAKLQKSIKENDELREKIVTLNQEVEKKVSDTKTEYEAKLLEQIEQSNQRDYNDALMSAINDPEIKLRLPVNDAFDLIRLRAEKEGLFLKKNEKGAIEVVVKEGDQYRKAQTFDGKNFISDPKGLVREIAAKHDLFAKSNTENIGGAINEIINGKTIDHSGAEALRMAMAD